MSPDVYQELVDGIGQATCGARRKNGLPCTLRAGFGTDHFGIGACKYHCGSVPAAKVAAQRRVTDAAVRFYGLPREIAPHDALREEVWRAAGHVQWLEEAVSRIDGPRVPLWHEAPGIDVEIAKKAWVPAAMVIQLYGIERDRLAERAAIAIKCGIEDRKVRIIESQAHLLAQVCNGFIAELGLDRNDPKVRLAMRNQLQLAATIDVEVR